MDDIHPIPTPPIDFPAGQVWPFGATWIEEEQAFNFALFSRHATHVTLLCYRTDDSVTPVFTFDLRHPEHKTGNIWHCRIPVAAMNGATLYAYRVDGPREIRRGHRFDPEKILLDPYTPEVFFPPGFSRKACEEPGPTDGKAPLGMLLKPRQALARNIGRAPHHLHDVVIYELHVKGFTANPNSGVTEGKRGTFAGLIEKIPYLQELGVTVVELLPIHQFDPQEGNYWGYMTLNFFSPHRQYATGDAFDEFREMIRALHSVGIELWLDVVYNHTAEGNEYGPNYSFRGIDNKSYYLLNRDHRCYLNDTGCGNTLRTGHPAGRALVLESLRFWGRKMGVDGFRFDLASIFSRSSTGLMDQSESPLIMEISYLGRLLDVMLVAEAWDIGSYQLGRAFPGLDWMQWNGQFRDDVRSFVKSDPGMVGPLMQRLYGSNDLFPDKLHETYRPHQSINFITAHDGFCLYDLVSYNQKHNEANGHDNTDGSDYNLSWNCGHEGDIGTPPEVEALRRRQVRNFCAVLFLAHGTPMMVAGDEFLNTQHGNNNPYNQDNEIAWLDWGRLQQYGDVFRFFKLMIAFRKAHPSIGRPTFWREDVTWYGADGPPDLGPDSHALAYCLHGDSLGDDDIYVMINSHWEECFFHIQEGSPSDWLRLVDTSRPCPDDFVQPGQEHSLESHHYLVGARSVVVLLRPRHSGATT
ncbi:MAG: isoamylase [Methylacidiphilales bacterium]|nr:isoamylase [Candidatus Methylacidiphilales bacterium]